MLNCKPAGLERAARHPLSRRCAPDADEGLIKLRPATLRQVIREAIQEAFAARPVPSAVSVEQAAEMLGGVHAHGDAHAAAAQSGGQDPLLRGAGRFGCQIEARSA